MTAAKSSMRFDWMPRWLSWWPILWGRPPFSQWRPLSQISLNALWVMKSREIWPPQHHSAISLSPRSGRLSFPGSLNQKYWHIRIKAQELRPLSAEMVSRWLHWALARLLEKLLDCRTRCIKDLPWTLFNLGFVLGHRLIVYLYAQSQFLCNQHSILLHFRVWYQEKPH